MASNRRKRFQEHMALLDAAADPYVAIERNLYVDRPAAAAHGIVRRLELKPASTHLLVGGIGCGKTTQILIVRDELRSLGDTVPLYIDVSERQDLGTMKVGGLFAIAGLAVCDLPTINSGVPDLAKHEKWWRQWATGYWDPDDYPDYDEPGNWVQGVVTPPDENVPADIKLRADDFAAICRSRIPEGHTPVFLFDSLDRMSDLRAFEQLVVHDLAAIDRSGSGAVVVGPLRAMYGLERVVADRFERYDYVSAIDIAHEESALTFLVEVLRKRGAQEIMTSDASESLARMSGGVLRDLIHLARLALEETYLSGSDRIEVGHVNAAAATFGRTQMIGLSQSDLAVLQRVRTTGTFVQTSEEELALLATRRVLEYRNSGLRYSVHPTIAPLLAQLAGET